MATTHSNIPTYRAKAAKTHKTSYNMNLNKDNSEDSLNVTELRTN